MARLRRPRPLLRLVPFASPRKATALPGSGTLPPLQSLSCRSCAPLDSSSNAHRFPSRFALPLPPFDSLVLLHRRCVPLLRCSFSFAVRLLLFGSLTSTLASTNQVDARLLTLFNSSQR